MVVMREGLYRGIVDFGTKKDGEAVEIFCDECLDLEKYHRPTPAAATVAEPHMATKSGRWRE